MDIKIKNSVIGGMKVIIDILYENREPRIYQDYSPTIRSERTGLLVLTNKGEIYGNKLLFHN